MVELGFPVIASTGVPRRFRTGRIAAISKDSPLLEMASTRSAAVIMPRSPWLASPGCTNMAGVPVDARVAAILRPTWPLLPMPMTTTRPLLPSTRATAREKQSSMRSAMALTAVASMRRVSRARARARTGSNVGGRLMPELSPLCPGRAVAVSPYHYPMNSLDITLLYLLAAVLGVVVCRQFKLPPMLGYLVVGVVIGPNALALAQNSSGVRYLAEFGVVFLMFVI